jgi:MFS family permease
MTRDSIAEEEGAWGYRGWRVVIACFAMALFAWGFGFYGHAVYLAEVQRQHDWPAALVAGASTACYLVGAVLVAFVGDAVRRYGPRRVVLAGIACMATSAMLLPWVSAPWQLYAVYLPMAAGWAALGLGAITNVLGLWFHARRGMAISLALNGASCGGIVLVPLLVMMTDQWGFSVAMAVASACMVVVLVPLTLAWVGAPNAKSHSAEDARAAVAPSAPLMSKGEALRSLHFWTVAGPFALGLTTQVGFIVHQIAFLSPLIGRAGAGAAVAVTTVMAVVGRVGLGFVIDRLNQRLTTAFSFASQAAALLLMSQTSDTTLLLGACAVFGFSVGNLITFPALIIQREFDPRAFGALVALATAVCQFTYAFGPGLLGLIRDLTGGYPAALFACIAFNIAATAIVLIPPKASAGARAT